MTQPRLLTQAEAREYLGGIGATKLWELRVAGEIEIVKIGRSTKYDRDSLDAYIDRQLNRDK